MQRSSRLVKLQIMHIVPGRIRLFCASFKNGELSSDRLKHPLRLSSFVNCFETNRITGSLIIRFNAEQHTLKEIFLCLIKSYPWARIEPCFGLSFKKHGTDCIQKIQPFKNDLRQVLVISISIVVALLVRKQFRNIYDMVMPCWLTSISIPVFKAAYQTLVENNCLGIEVLDTTVIGLSIIRKNYLPSLFMLLLYSIGTLIKNRTREYSRRKIHNLIEIKKQTARIIKNKTVIEINADMVKSDDHILVHAGESISVDGIVIDGTAQVNQQVLTGESLSVHKSKGEQVYASTRLEEGSLLIKAQKTGEYTKAANIVKIVEKALQQKIQLHYKLEELANKMVPLTFFVAGLSYLFTGSLRNVMSVLMIDYGSGIRISMPIAIMSCLFQSSGKGMLIKDGNAIEQLSRVDQLAGSL